MARLIVSLLALLATQVLVSPAHAEPELSSDQGGDLVKSGIREHDGFYLRLGLGFGAFGNSLVSEDESFDHERSQAQINGVSSVGEIMIGGVVHPQWIVGGGLWTSTVLASNYSHEAGDRVPLELREPDNFTLLGPFFDWYFDAKHETAQPGGFHFQGGAGLAVLNGWRQEAAREDDTRRVAIGGGLMAGIGYEWWIEDQWAIGALARLTLAGLVERDQNDDYWYHGVATVPALLFTGTYN